MADGDIGFESTNLFNLAAAFNTQSSSTRETRTYAQTLASDGDVGCEDSFNVVTEYTQTAEYCGSDLKTDLGTFLTTVGAVQNSILPTQIEINFSNQARPSVTITGHQHAANAHTTGLRQFNASGILAASVTGNGVPTLGVTNDLITFDAASAATSASYTVGFEHMDTQDATGDQFAGQNRTCRVDVSVEGLGADSDVTLGSNWSVDDKDSSDENQGPDTFAVTAHQFIDAI